MARHVRLNELLVGVEGLALLRGLYDGSDDDAGRRIAEIRRVLGDDSFAAAEAMTEVDPRTGYRVWAESYDDGGNPIMALEESVVTGILEPLSPGRALDAACGTGRYARHLARLGHEVIGVDVTAEMLARATASVPEARFIEADLREVPVDDEQFDLVVCGLALAHLEDFAPAVAEFSRVLKPGGRVVISVLHPF